MTKVMHLIGNLRLGGGQKITYAVLHGLPRSEFQTSVCCLEEGGHYGELLRSEGIPVFALGHKKNYGMRGLLRSSSVLSEMVSLLKREKPDILHTHLFGAGLVGRVAAQLAGVPVAIHTLHRIFYPMVQPMVEYLLSPFTKAIVVDSNAVGDLIRRRCRLPAKKVHVIYNGVDRGELAQEVTAVEARRTLALPGNFCDPKAKLIGVVAHLQPHKGQRYLIEALPQICSSGIDARLVLVGDGSDRAALTALIRRLDLVDRVHFAGYRSEMNLILSALDLLVLPSAWEGFGLALAEGMYKRLPAVSTNRGGSAEVITDGQTGLLVPFGDVAGLADSAKRILSTPALAMQMGAAGRDKVESMFTTENMISNYAKLYRQMQPSRSPLPLT